MRLTSFLALLATATSMAQDDASPQTCYESETPELLCYRQPQGVPQNVRIEDIATIASYLREYGRETDEGRLWVMRSRQTPYCAEWTVFSRGSALVLAKHIDPSRDTAVLFQDIATTLDGGPNASDADQSRALISCMTDGGSLGVLVNASEPVYKSPAYVQDGLTPEGILIKVVANGPGEL